MRRPREAVGDGEESARPEGAYARMSLEDLAPLVAVGCVLAVLGQGINERPPPWRWWRRTLWLHPLVGGAAVGLLFRDLPRSEEHTSELQSREKLVCRLLLEKKNPKQPSPRKLINQKAGQARAGQGGEVNRHRVYGQPS